MKTKTPKPRADIFARLDGATAARFARIVAAIRPPTTRSKVIAMLIGDYVEREEKK